jgi:hypothetical protein
MTIRIHIIARIALGVLASLAVGALTAPGAAADPPQGHPNRPPAVQQDLVERWVDGRAGTRQPDLVERYVASHSTGSAPRANSGVYQAQPSSASAPSADSRIDEGFRWSDAGIGAIAGFTLTLAAGGTLLAARGRSRVVRS